MIEKSKNTKTRRLGPKTGETQNNILEVIDFIPSLYEEQLGISENTEVENKNPSNQLELDINESSQATLSRGFCDVTCTTGGVKNEVAERRIEFEGLTGASGKDTNIDRRERKQRVLAAWETKKDRLGGEETCQPALKIFSEAPHKTLGEMIKLISEVIRALLSLLDLVCNCEGKDSHHFICFTFSVWWKQARFIVQPEMIDAFKACYRSVHGVEYTVEDLRLASQNGREMSVAAVKESLSFLYLKMEKASRELVSQLVGLGKSGKSARAKNVSDDCTGALNRLKTLKEPLQSLFADNNLAEDVDEYMEISRISPDVFDMVKRGSHSWHAPEEEYTRMSRLLSEHQSVWATFAGDQKHQYSKKIEGLNKAFELIQKMQGQIDALCHDNLYD